MSRVFESGSLFRKGSSGPRSNFGKTGNMRKLSHAGASFRSRSAAFDRVPISLVVALAAASASSAAQAVEVFPETVSPLQIQQDPNGVNLTTGKITFDVPTLSVPAAPRLKFDRVQNAAPYFKGSVTGAIGETSSGNFSVHTGAASSEAFSCSDGDVCASKTGSGSMFIPTGVGAATYREAGTGAIYDFDSQQVRETMNNPNTTMYYASKITYPDGEVISFTYSKHYVAAQYDPATGFRTPQYYYHRPTKVTSSLGYHITITYLSDTWLDAGWSGPKEVALYQSGNATPLDKLIYDGSITDPGDLADLTDDKVYKCDTACGNYMGGSIEAVEGSLTLPGDTSPSLVVTQHPDTADLSNVRLVGSVTRDGARWTYSYGNLRRDLSSFGRYFYDTVTVTGPNNYRVVYGMRSGGNGNWIESIQERVDASAGLTRLTEIPEYTYHRPKLIVHPEKNEEEVSYDSYGNVVSKITRAKPLSGLANITESARVIDTSMCDMGLSSVLCYRPNVITDGRGNETRYAYNDKGQMTVRTDPLAGGVTRQTRVTYETSTAGTSRKKVVRVCAEATATQPTTCATNDEAWTEYVYWGNTSLPTLERRIDKATGVTLDTKYAYDAAGRLLEVDGPLVSGRQDVIFYRYDSHGRKEWEIGALGANGVRMATRYYYRNSDDKVFRVETGAVAAAEPAVGTAPAFVQVQKRVDTSYNARRKPTREKLVAGGVVQQVTDRAYLLRGDLECEATRMNPNVYDALPVSACDQSVTTETRPHGPDRITRNYYDDAGQLLKVQKGYGMALQQDYATYTYSLNGKRTSVKDANGNLAQMTYDGHDRQFKWIFPNGDFEEYGYDANGNRTSLTKRDGLTLTYTYDALDRMTRKTVPERSGLHPLHTRDVTYTYDLLDHQRSARFVATASTPVEGVTNGYDTLGRMLWSKIDMEGVERVLYHGYDAAGRRTQLTHADGHIVTYAYDPAGRTKGIYEGVGTTTPLATFAYDTLGRLDLRTDGPGSSVDYGYDVIGRLETQTDLFTGGAGNVLTTLAYNPANQIIRRKREDVTGSVGQADLYAWDGHKEVERAYNANTLNQYTAAGPTAFTHEKNGSLASETSSQGATSYTYDVENRLVQATGLNAATFRYDPLGRIFKVGSVTFLYDGDALIGEI